MTWSLSPAFVVAFLCSGPVLMAAATIDHILVSQGIQDETNSVPLVAGRSATVRAKIGGLGGGPSGLTARLEVVSSSIILSSSPDLRTGFSSPTAPDLDDEKHTINFEVNDIGFLSLIPGSTVTFKVSLSTGATSTTPPFTLVGWRKLKLFYIPIEYDPPGTAHFPAPGPGLIGPGSGNAMVKGVLPVRDFDADLYRAALYPDLLFTIDDGNGGIDIDEVNDLLSALEGRRTVMVADGLGASPDLYLFGWIANNTVNGSSGYSAYGPSNVGFGEVNPVRFQRTYAHELCHQLGIAPHSSRILDPSTGWDVGPRLPNNPLANAVSGHVRKRALYGIMRSGVNTAKAWVDVLTYTRVLNNLIVDCEDAACEEPISDLDDPTPDAISVRGILDPAGTKLREPLKVFRYPWLQKPTPQSRRARFEIELTGEKGQIARRFFDARRIEEPDEDGDGDQAKKAEGRRERHGFFTVIVPFKGRVEQLRILDRNGNKEIVRLMRSKAVPRITILRPSAGDRLEGKVTVEFTVDDPDSKESDLLYQVVYSPDGGKSFSPVGVDLKERQIQFDTSQFPSADGKGIIRIFASDGLNTSHQDMEKLTVSGRARKE